MKRITRISHHRVPLLGTSSAAKPGYVKHCLFQAVARILLGVVALVLPKIGSAAEPARQWVVYLLPHSHVDIGYTHVQTEVERKHWSYYQQAIEAARRTADYPPDARFKWNVEVLWAVDSYLRQASPEKQQAFIEAVKHGSIELDALYGNELTGLCRPEELLRLCDYARQVSRRCGVTIDRAMITDVPGYTWGLTAVLADAGVKYISMAPNVRDRIGYTMAAWADKPFYWITPDGKHKVLCWVPAAYGEVFKAANVEKRLPALLRRLEAKGYPYDLVQIRFCVGDNAGPAVEAQRPGQELERRARLAAPCHRNDVRDDARVRAALRREAAGVSRRFHAVLGRRSRLDGPRNGPQPRLGRTPRPGRNALCHAPPGQVSRRAILRCLAQRHALRRAHLGCPHEYHQSRLAVLPEPMADQAGLCPRRR